MTEHERYAAALQDLYQRTTQGIKLGLDSTRQLLHVLGDPQNDTKHIVVAGTNGKGSTSSLLAAVCEAAGYTTGLYTSPHLLRFTERIQINGEEISQAKVLEYYERIRSIESSCDAMPTFFEVATAMALMAFSEAGVEVAIMEVGLGGRLDSTNVVDKCLSIITPIDLDHVHILGDTIEEIAAEKAGIIASNAAALTAPQKPEAMEVLRLKAHQEGTTLHETVPMRLGNGCIHLGRGEQPIQIEFSGPEYQASNITTVFSALPLLEAQGFDTRPEHLTRALKRWTWPGRYQKIKQEPLIILDGAHNPHALNALFDNVQRLEEGPTHVVFSAIHTKDAALMIQQLRDRASGIHLCPSSVGKSLGPEGLKDIAPNLPVYDHATDALQSACQQASSSGGHVLVTGSLFLVADILHHLTGDRRDPGVVS